MQNNLSNQRVSTGTTVQSQGNRRLAGFQKDPKKF